MIWLLACTPETEQAAPVEAAVQELDLAPWTEGLAIASRHEEERATGVLEVLEVRAASDPHQEARAFADSLPPEIEAYVTSQNDLDVDVRVYQGKRQTHHLTFRPALQHPAPRRGLERPLVAVLIEGLGRDPQAAQEVLEAPLAISLAVRPFTPFALLHARDAPLEHKELLVEIQPDDPLPLALEAVPWSTGVLLHQPRPFQPDQLSEYYVVDGTTGETLGRLPVPTVGVGERVEGDIGPSVVRIENLADRNGAVIVLVSLQDREAVRSTLHWLYEGQDRMRAVFVSEIVDWQRRTGSRSSGGRPG